ncbi:MAG TPA: (2Fe-2S) ferredoxin domain-containing protein [Bacteroides sp.]|nr:(2Fe-2S) ferredoxin domain-containing protein [Bacteroides sp.]
MALVRKEIRICMGSSCFSRGNRHTLQLVQKYLKDHHLERDVVLKGSHCFDQCSNGPILKIDSRVYENVNRDHIIEILEEELGDL